MTRPKKPPPRARSGKHLHAGVLVRAPDAELEAWGAAAAAAGLPRAAWIRGELNAAAARQLKKGPSFDAHADAERFRDAWRTLPKKKDRAKKG